jgi:hypothetical protein
MPLSILIDAPDIDHWFQTFQYHAIHHISLSHYFLQYHMLSKINPRFWRDPLRF